MKKLVLSFVAAALLSFTLVACGGDPLQKEVEEAQKSLPMKAGEGIMCISIELLNNYVTYTCEVDETLYGEEFMDLLSASQDEMKEAMLEPDEDTQELVDLCKKENKGLAYKYVGTITGKNFTIYLEPDDLK